MATASGKDRKPAKQPKAPSKARPSGFTQEKADAICERLAEGYSLRKVCRELKGPDPSTVLAWVEKHEAFAQQYAQARARGYQLLADEILEISDDGASDVDEDGKPNAEAVARSKLRVDSRKWMLSKMLPKVYGEKVTQELTGANGGPVLIANAAELTDDQLAAIAAGHAQR